MQLKSFALLVLPGLLLRPVYSGTQSRGTARQAKVGESVQLDESLSVKATTAAKSPFATVKTKGEAVAVVIEVDAGKKSATLFYMASPDAKSEIYLNTGAQKLAPVAVMEDFPSWGGDNDKEVEV